MITIKDVNYTIKQRKILQNINIDIPKGGITALIGPNGAGKSTLFSLMSRLKPCQTGTIHFDNLNVSTAKANDIAKKVAILTQENTLHAKITVEDLLMFGRYPYHQGNPTEEDQFIVKQGLSQFKLLDYASYYLSELSGGQRQRALVAMIFCQSTDYLLLDEPLNNLDMYHAKYLMLALQELAAEHNKTIVIVLHDINQAIQYSNHIIAMKNGSVLLNGTPEEVITQDNLYDIFNVDCDIIYHKGIKRVIF